MSFVELLVDYLQNEITIYFNLFDKFKIIPYNIFNIDGINTQKIYNWLEEYYLNRLKTTNDKNTKLLSFDIKIVDENQYQLHIEYYSFKKPSKIENEDDYILSEQMIQQFLYQCLYNGLIPTSKDYSSGLYEFIEFENEY